MSVHLNVTSEALQNQLHFDSILLECDTQLSIVKFSSKYLAHYISHVFMQYLAVVPVQKHQNSITGHKEY